MEGARSMDSVECLVIGAGVVGLAIARALARSGREVIVLESEPVIGSGVSSRNSEVIHAGIYYPSDLDKTRLCVEGKTKLYAFCQDFGVPHRRCGKILVATTENEVGQLAAIKARAEANGVADLTWLDVDEARALEPALAARRALLSPSTGIINSHAFMLALEGDAERHGAMLALETPVVSGRAAARGLIMETGGANPTQIAANVVVNSAGLGAQALARSIAGMPRDKIPPLHLAKGNYFALAPPSPFSHLIYPIPTPGGLGVHLTLDMNGRARFGPDVEWIEFGRLRRRSQTRGCLLCRGSLLLAGLARWRSAAGLFRDKAEDRAAGRVEYGFSHSGPKEPRGGRIDQSVRNRISRAHVEPCDCRLGRRDHSKAARDMNWTVEELR